MLNRKLLWLVGAALFVLVGCNSPTPPDHLIGNWEVINIYRGGQSIVGPGFHGSHLLFQKNGMVKSWEHRGDTSEVEYIRRGDSLIWVTMDQDMVYMIDSLSENALHLQLDQEGFKSLVVLQKVKGN